MTGITVRLATDEDLGAAIDVERSAFASARGDDPADDIVGAIENVADEPDSFGVIAVQGDGRVVGHAQFTRAWVGSSPTLLLGPVGVAPDRWGRGIGSRLIEFGLSEATKRDEAAVILLGDPRFYGRFGFVPASRYGLRNPMTGVQPSGFTIEEEHLQIKALGPRADDLAGAVRWHPALK